MAIRIDRATVRRYVANAAAHMLQMIEDGRVEVKGHAVTVKDAATARKIKLGKLQRHLFMMNAKTKKPNSTTHKVAVATWQAVAHEVSNLRTKTAMKKAVKAGAQ